MKKLINAKFILPKIPFYFIRHGETAWNKNGIIMGQKDIPLNEIGIQQAHEVVKYLCREPIQHIFSSPLMRSHQTATIIDDVLKVGVTIIDDLMECSWGIYEGKPIQNALLDKWFKGEIGEEVEPITTFSSRVYRGIQKCLSYPEPVLIVSHGGCYAVLQTWFGFLPTKIENCNPIFHRPPEKEGIPWFMYSLVS